MPPLLVRAPSLSAATAHAMERWAARGGHLVLPRRDAVVAALQEATGGGGVLMGRDAVTFAGLRGRVAAAAGSPEPELPSRVALRLGLREVLERVDLAAFGPSAEAPGFLTGIERAVGELRAARVPPARVVAAAATPATRALAEVHAAAWEAVPHPSDALWAAADLARGLRAFPPVTVAGVDDLAPGEWALLGALSRAGDVEVVLPHRPDHAAHTAREGRWRRWAAGVRLAEVDPAPAGPLGHLARRLFADGPPLAAPPPLALVGAAGTRGMLRVALEEALAAAHAGVPPHRIALVVPRLAELRDDLERLLDDWDVPARRSTRVRVLEAPLALALTHLLRLGELEPDAPGALDHLLGWLRTPYGGADPAEVDLFEVDARRAGLGRRGELMRRWDDAVMAPARRLVAAARQGPRAQLAALLEHGWEALRRVSADGPEPGRADRRDRAALSALAGLARAVGEPEEAPAPDEEPPARPRGPLPPGALGEILADLTFTEREGPAEGIDVHDLASLRGRAYDVVVLTGLDGDGVPGRPAPDPFLGPLRAALADVLPPRAPGTSESRLRLVHAVDAAAARLVLVRRVVDDDGREVAPSPYWAEAARLAGRPAGALDRRTGARGEVVDDPAAAPTEAEALRALAVEGAVVPGPLEEAAARRARPLGVPPDAFHGRRRFRVTELESYLRCPYGWLRDNVICPEELEQRADLRFEGSLGHAVLQAVYARMRDEGVGPCAPATLARYRTALEDVLPQVAARERPPDAGAPYTALVERMLRHLTALLAREAALGSRLVPTRFEERMEDAEILAGVAPGVALSGQVDRLDLSPDGRWSLVIDYKRSRGDFRPGSDDVTQRLQLPLYGVMARRALAPDAEPAGGLYMGILQPRVDGAVRDDVPGAPAVGRSCSVSAARWAQIAEEAIEAAREAVRRIRAGELAPPPARDCPEWCGCGDLWR